MGRLLIVATTTALMIPAIVFVQARPNFTGTWTLDQSRTGYNVAGITVVLHITHDDGTFRQRLGDQELIFPLDGSETTNQMKSSAGPVKLSSRAAWDGQKLVLRMDAPSSQGYSTQTLSLSADGQELTIEMGGVGPNGPRNGTTVFTKS
jgi:hypothetical protein